ncbi:MAG: cell division protein FtsL [Burkholderiaceae bacterium]
MSARTNGIIAALLVVCALSLVNAQYNARRLYVELGRAQSQAELLDVQWAQLQLDQSTLGKHARIELVAKRDLKMLALTSASTQYLTVEGK